MESSFNIEDKTLVITTKGKGPTFEEVKKFSQQMFEECLRNSCSKILADDREQQYSLSDYELFELGEYHASVMPAIIKFAVVTTQANIDKIKLWENTAFNRGRNVKVFSEMNDAKIWLQSPS